MTAERVASLCNSVEYYILDTLRNAQAFDHFAGTRTDILNRAERCIHETRLAALALDKWLGKSERQRAKITEKTSFITHPEGRVFDDTLRLDAGRNPRDIAVDKVLKSMLDGVPGVVRTDKTKGDALVTTLWRLATPMSNDPTVSMIVDIRRGLEVPEEVSCKQVVYSVHHFRTLANGELPPIADSA